MTNDNFERLQKRIGEAQLTVEEFHIERGKIAEFAEAIGEDAAVFRDRTVAKKRI